MRNNRMQLVLTVLGITCLLAATTPARATFPGLNGRIAFQAQATPDAHVQIYTVRPNGHELRQITNFTDAGAVTPDWSPDGRQIVFEIDRDHEPFCGIALMNADGITGPDLYSPPPASKVGSVRRRTSPNSKSAVGPPT
jgi:Tol biopolymer transport system component